MTDAAGAAGVATTVCVASGGGATGGGVSTGIEAWAVSKTGTPLAAAVEDIGGGAMPSVWSGACGCMACIAPVDKASVPADIGVPAWLPALKFWARPSGERAAVGVEGDDGIDEAAGGGVAKLGLGGVMFGETGVPTAPTLGEGVWWWATAPAVLDSKPLLCCRAL